MRFKYTLKRANRFIEDIEADRRIVAFIQKGVERRNKSKFIEQSLGIMPIPIRDFLYKQLVI
jgi:hypothetical protein